MGSAEITASAGVSNRLLDRPVRAMHNGVFDESSDIPRSLVDLRHTVEDLDPSKQGDLLSPRRLLGLIPFGNRLLDYFHKYQSSQSHLERHHREPLSTGQDELLRDNAAIEQEKVNLWGMMERLEQYAYMEKARRGADRKIATIERKIPRRGVC